MPRTLPEWLAYIEQQHPKSIDMGLERVRKVATRMGLKRPAKKVITVAGTNGKGSTVAFIEAIARAAGWSVGAYTSPHLLAYNERVRIDGHDAGDEDLVAAFEAIDAAARGDVLSPSPVGRGVGVRVRRSDGRQNPVREPGTGAAIGGIAASPPDPHPPVGHLLPEGEGGKHISLTYFEYGTLCALWLFQRSKLDLAVLEVGLGGRLDATNLVDPDVAVITTVDLDHQDWLGGDREPIGFEKAGIARAWKPLVLGDDDPPSSVLGHAYAIGASAVRANCDFFFDRIDAGHWRWREVGYALELPVPQLAGPVQLRNASIAIAALRALGKPLQKAAIAQGVAAAHVAGRLQRFERDGVEIVVDVGHNPQAARQLAAWLQASPATGRTHAVFAALGDKDLTGVVTELAGRIDHWHLAGLVESGPRGLDVDAFAQRLAGTPAGAGMRHIDVAHALAAARTGAQAGDRILVFGSFHTAATAMAALGS